MKAVGSRSSYADSVGVNNNKTLAEVALSVAAENVVIGAVAWSRLKIDQFFNWFTKHVVSDLSVERDVVEKSWVFSLIFVDRLTGKVLSLPLAAKG